MTGGIIIEEDRKKYGAIVTDIGNELIAKAVVEGEKVKLTYFAVGDGEGIYYEPETNMIALKNEVWRGKINSFELLEETKNVFLITAICPGDAGGFSINEIAVFDEEGRMFAICNSPSIPKVTIIDGVVQEIRLEMEVAIVNSDVVELVVDPNIVTATKADVEKVWNYLKKIGKVIIGLEDTDIENNDICIIVDEIPYPEETDIKSIGIIGKDGSIAEVINAAGDRIGIL